MDVKEVTAKGQCMGDDKIVVVCFYDNVLTEKKALAVGSMIHNSEHSDLENFSDFSETF